MDRSAHAITRRPEATDDLLQRLLRQSRDHALILLDPHGRIVDWLAGAEHMFGYTGDEMVGEPVERLFTPEDLAFGAATHEREVANAVGKGEDDRWLVRKDGTRIWVTGVLTALREGDRIVGYGKVLRDRTDVKMQIDALDRKPAAAGRGAQPEPRRDYAAGAGLRERRPGSPAPGVPISSPTRSARPMSEGGLGVGLALVRELVALHGGLVQVRSEGRDKGSEFTVRLPLHRG